jgi:hypothetical protein
VNPTINKFLVAIASCLSVVAVVAPDGFTVQEVVLIILTGLGAIGVYAIPNASAKP